MIDLVFVVNDPVSWHQQNLEKNPHHYSGLRILGARCVAAIQDNVGAGVYYNTLVRCEGRVGTKKALKMKMG